MSEGALVETWEFKLSQPPSALWPLLADTNRIHEALEMPRYSVVVEREGESRKLVAHSGQGARRLEWEETPFEWVAGQWWRFDRRFLKGPLARFGATLYLRKSAGGGALAQYALNAEPNGVIGKTLLSSGYLRRAGDAFVERAEEVDAFLSGRRPTPFSTREPGRLREARAEIDGRAAQMAQSPYANGAAASLANMVAEAPISDLMEMRARRLARSMEVSERAAAEACLAAVEAGLLELRLIALCPRCRRPALEASRLAELPATAQCRFDGLTFAIDLAVNVEALFTPRPEARSLGEGVFCGSGPMTAPHVSIRQRLEAGERRAFPFTPRPGGYRVWVEPADARVEWLEGDGAARISADRVIDYQGGQFPAVAAAPDGVTLGGDPGDGAVVFENHCSQPRLISLERRAWRADALTAAELTPLQAYRDLFPLDAPQAPTRSGRLVFAAFAVPAPEALFARLGDIAAAAAIDALAARAADLARARNGGVVRASGARGLAAFLDAADAAGFALELKTAARMALAEILTDTETPPISVGIASGRALALKRPGGFDYSGLTAAMAERLAVAAAPGEVALPADIANQADVAAILANCVRRDDSLAIDGVDEALAIARVT